MNIYDTYYMLAAIEEIPLEHTFFRSRYFPTNQMLDVFNTCKVLADYKKQTNKRAPFVLPRIGSLPVGREDFSTYELEPAYIGVSMPLTLDQLKKRGFGESLMSTMSEADRARIMQMSDMQTLSAMISRTEELMACETMLNNGCTMRHETDKADTYEDVPVKFYEGDTNPAAYTVSAAWAHSTVKNGVITKGSFYTDICKMVKALKHRGLPATDLIVASDVGEFLMDDPWVLSMLDNRRVEMGHIQPTELTEYVTHLGSFNFDGRNLDILINDGSYDKDGTDTPYLADGSVIVTAPNCGRGLYGAHTQMEANGEWVTYAGMRIPQHIFTVKPPVSETQVVSRPLMVPNRPNPWVAAKNVLTAGT